MVGLEHQVVGLADERLHLVGHVAGIGHQAEHHAVDLDAVAHIVGAVVRNAKRCNLEITQLEGRAFLDYPCIGGGNLSLYAIVVLYAYMNIMEGIHGQVEFLTQHSHVFHVVGMVMGYKYGLHVVEFQAIVIKTLL